ncbi:MAG: hypothetical protein MUD16_09720 [Desulfobacterales bacterium]|jgi:hypothetical protein|nr:hypothetical protein [Desulfobacterales bacterium]
MKIRVAIRLLAVCTAVFFLAAACAGTAVSKAGNAKVAIDPPSGKKGTAVSVVGTGFKPGEVVDVTLDLGGGLLVGLGTEKVEAITADAAGAFKVASGIPAVAKPGTYKVTVDGNKGSVAKADLIVVP